MKKLGFNPYLPSWEYVPDGEPHVFGDRVFVYGSHDKFNGYAYCLNDYVCWSAPVTDLSDWRYEGVIYKKTDDPANPDGFACLYAPDVTKGPDGKYYLYYVLDKVSYVSVAVCDTPAGKYKFYGNVKHPDGTLLGKKEGDQPQFDPGVLTEGDKTYLYTGFAGPGDKSRLGATAQVLDKDMLTIIEGPVVVAPGNCYGKGSGFEGFEFFEAPSIRKIDDTYYFVYSSIKCNELCYATSKNPLKDFKFGGVIVSNIDLHIDSYKPANKAMRGNGNNHGGIECINGKYYIFYHRHSNGHEFSRQACLEPITILEDGSIPQVEITSCGPNGGPLPGKGTYPAYIACHYFSVNDLPPTEELNWPHHDPRLPYPTQDEHDGNDYEDHGFAANIRDNCGIGFKYFDCKDIKRVTIKTRGYSSGKIEVRTKWDGEALGEIKLEYTNIWKDFSADIKIPDGVQSIYFVYKGPIKATIKSFTLE